MNFSKRFHRFAAGGFALLAGFILAPAGRAQSTPQISDNRYLFIFDTSADMKKRLPAVQAEVKQLLATSLGGQLHAGDSLGVWTFDQNLRTGQFRLQQWRLDDSAIIASNINKLVGKQHYANSTHFSALQPQLNQVIQDSGRLTVLIFSDGEDEIKWTPYDAGINQVFQQRSADQKKTRQPFILVFRTQHGQYAGCTMNFPPGMVSVPEFPPPPPPPAPAAPVKTPPPAPVIKPPIGLPLIIVGTKVETNSPPTPVPAPIKPVAPTNPVTQPPPTNATPLPSAGSTAPANPVASMNPVVSPPPSNPAPAIQTSAVPAPPAASFTPTNSAPVTSTNLAPTPAPNRTAPTNAVAPSPENAGSGHKGALVIGVALLVAAVVLVVLVVFRGRRADRNSLITRSMKKD